MKSFETCEGKSYDHLEFNQTLPAFVVNRLSDVENYVAFVGSRRSNSVVVEDLLLLSDDDISVSSVVYEREVIHKKGAQCAFLIECLFKLLTLYCSVNIVTIKHPIPNSLNKLYACFNCVYPR